MSPSQKAKRFASLHVKGTPLILYNAWDAGSANAILDAGAKAIATSSWSVAEAQGYRDGEFIPLAFVEQIVGRIASAINAPLTVDFEGGYSEDDAVLADNVTRLLDLGVIGINFEDRVVHGDGLYTAYRQSKRIRAIREAATKKGVDLFINARTDTFFAEGNPADFMTGALERAKAYTEEGASGFFVPGLTDDALIEKICASTPLPVNVMVMDGLSPTKKLAKLGVSRVSYGPIPYADAMKTLKTQAAAAMQ
jgi:2-methylisocitrate lyase-like PEP mutase family enzyme